MATQIVAPMPGKVLNVKVNVGDTVSFGQDLLTMEAMKMEIPIRSTANGVVKEIKVAAGQSVAHGFVMVEVE